MWSLSTLTVIGTVSHTAVAGLSSGHSVQKFASVIVRYPSREKGPEKTLYSPLGKQRNSSGIGQRVHEIRRIRLSRVDLGVQMFFLSRFFFRHSIDRRRCVVLRKAPSLLWLCIEASRTLLCNVSQMFLTMLTLWSVCCFMMCHGEK